MSSHAQRRRTRMGFVGRILRHLARLVVVLGPVALLITWAVPIDPTDPFDGSGIAELLASLIETLRLHLGCMLGIASVGLLVLRSWRMALVGVLFTAWAVLPAVTWPAVDRSARAGAPSLRVLSVNLGGVSPDAGGVVDQVLAAGIDVLVLQEYTPEHQDRLAAPLAANLPHRHERVRTDDFGMAIFSRLPWVDIERLQLAASGTPQLRVEFRLGHGLIVLYALHLLPPTAAYWERHRLECAELLRRIGKEENPVVLLGDFNFVDHGAVGRALHARGLYDAHGLAGGGRGATWPVNGWLRRLPGIRIDHIYLGRGLTSTCSWVGGHVGGDHLPTGCTIVPMDDSGAGGRSGG